MEKSAVSLEMSILNVEMTRYTLSWPLFDLLDLFYESLQNKLKIEAYTKLDFKAQNGIRTRNVFHGIRELVLEITFSFTVLLCCKP